MIDTIRCCGSILGGFFPIYSITLSYSDSTKLVFINAYTLSEAGLVLETTENFPQLQKACVLETN